MYRYTWLGGLFCAVLIVLLGLPVPTFSLSPDDYFKVKVVDAETGRGVPLVKLETVNNIVYYTDSAGVAAIFEPALMNKDVWFSVDSQGYEFSGPASQGGIQLHLRPGASKTIEIGPQNIAKRLYRVTGHGIYRDSHLVQENFLRDHPFLDRVFGEAIPIETPLLNTGEVLGQDATHTAVFRDRIFWQWGDTQRLPGPNQMNRSTVATSKLPFRGGLNPQKGVNLQYFVGDDGKARGLYPPSIGSTVWTNNLLVVENNSGEQEMFAPYTTPFGGGNRIDLEGGFGVARWNDQTKKFENVRQFSENPKITLAGKPVRIRMEGQEWFYLARPYPVVRVPATSEALADPNQYEAFTPFEKGTIFTQDGGLSKGSIKRDSNGNPVWGWRTNTSSLDNWRARSRLRSINRFDSSSNIFHLRDINTDRAINAQRGTVYWNEYRQKWVMVFGEVFGKFSLLGDLWYAEADSPIGPWVYARRIVRHNNFSCYLPVQHKMFDQHNGKRIFFECTYSEAFSSGSATPRYNYNQIMYQLDLSDPRLHLPSPVYHHQDRSGAHRYDTLNGLSSPRGGKRPFPGLDKSFDHWSDKRRKSRFRFFNRKEKHSVARGGIEPDSSLNADSIARNAPIPFYALPPDRPRPGTVPVWEKRDRRGAVKLVAGKSRSGHIRGRRGLLGRIGSLRFFAYPPDAEVENPHLVEIHEFKNRSTGRYVYSPSDPGPDWSRTKLAFQAWQSPNTNPPRAPGAEPVKTCMGASAYCDSNHDFHPFE